MFGWFKKEKNRILELPEQYASGFIQPLTSQQIEIKLGEKLVVRNGWCAVIVVKDKPQDVFLAGEYVLNIPSLPRTTRALKLDKSKVKKKGDSSEIVFPASFMCDLYFVNMSIITRQDWKVKRVHMKDKKCGRFNISLSGQFDFQTTDVANTMRLFLLETAFINPSKAQLRLQEYVAEFVMETLEWGKTTAPEILNDKSQVVEILAPSVTKKLSKYGINISNFSVDKIEFSRDIEAFLQQKVREQNQETQQDKIEEENKINEVTTTPKDNEIVENKEDKPEEIIEKVSPKDADTTDADSNIKTIFSDNKIGFSDKESKVDMGKLEQELSKISKQEISKMEQQEKEFFADDFLSNKLREKQEKAKEREVVLDFTKMDDKDLLDFEKEENKNNILDKNNKSLTKICPKCGKVHDLEDQICECGCNLD